MLFSNPFLLKNQVCHSLSGGSFIEPSLSTDTTKGDRISSALGCPPNQLKTPNLLLLLTKLCIHEVSFKESSLSPCTERILTNREKLHLLPTFWLCLGLMAFLCFSGKPFALGPAAKVEHHKRSFQSNSTKPYAGIQNSLHT